LALVDYRYRRDTDTYIQFVFMPDAFLRLLLRFPEHDSEFSAQLSFLSNSTRQQQPLS